MSVSSVLPNGEWRGWYEQKGSRSPTANNMVFSEGRVTGRGEDEVGDFEIAGSYNPPTATTAPEVSEVSWKKQYIGKHALVYESSSVQVGGSGQVEIKGTWHLDPPQRWDGSSGTFAFSSTNCIQPVSTEMPNIAVTSAASEEHAEAASITAEIAVKMREVAELRQRLRSLRSDQLGNATSSGSIGFELTRSTSRVLSSSANEDAVADTTCVVCVDAPRNAVLLWCGHQMLCIECARILYGRCAQCPICRETINQVQQVFQP